MGEAQDLANLGWLKTDTDDRDEACQWLQEALAIYQDIGAGGEGPDNVRAKLEELGCDGEAPEPSADEDTPTG